MRFRRNKAKVQTADEYGREHSVCKGKEYENHRVYNDKVNIPVITGFIQKVQTLFIGKK